MDRTLRPPPNRLSITTFGASSLERRHHITRENLATLASTCTLAELGDFTGSESNFFAGQDGNEGNH
jgi:hypothetical protein